MTSIPAGARARLAAACLVSLVLAIATGSAIAQDSPQDAPGIHARELAEHQGEPPSLTGDEEAIVGEALRVPRVAKQVVGFYPYWAGGFTGFHWDLLTTVAYFSAEVDASARNGTFGDVHGWGTSTASLISTAHANGVKVVLTVTLFDSTAITTILGDASYRTALVDNALALVQSAGGDGVCLDFEGVAGGSANKTGLVALMTALTNTFHAAIPGSKVLIATPAVDWNGVFDYDQLALATDGLMIMAYDYHWSGGAPGPVSPLTGGALWGTYNVAWTIADYVTWGGAANRSRFILGVPWYGYDWPTTSFAIPGTATGSATSRTYAQAKSRAQTSGSAWDAASQTPFVLYTSGGARQLWYDDDASISLKLDQVNSESLGGVGIWALGYEGANPELWTALETKLVPTCPDADGDGYPAATCGGTDCNDANPAIHPGAAEVCGNGVDENCSGVADEGCTVGCGGAPAEAAMSSGAGGSPRASGGFVELLPGLVVVAAWRAVRARRGRAAA